MQGTGRVSTDDRRGTAGGLSLGSPGAAGPAAGPEDSGSQLSRADRLCRAQRHQPAGREQAWMRDAPDAIPAIVAAVGRGLAAAPDTGNWTDSRHKGLAKAFPLAVTCDFKAQQLGPQGEHAPYDLNAASRSCGTRASAAPGAWSILMTRLRACGRALPACGTCFASG